MARIKKNIIMGILLLILLILSVFFTINYAKNHVIQNKDIRANNFNLPIIYYILFGVEGLLISLIIIYLIISQFNKKTLEEVFKSGDKITIFGSVR